MADIPSVPVTPAAPSVSTETPLSRDEASHRQLGDEMDAALAEDGDSDPSDDENEEGTDESSDSGDSEEADGDDSEDGETTDGESEEETEEDEGEAPKTGDKKAVRAAIKELESKFKDDPEALKQIKTLKAEVYTGMQYAKLAKSPEALENSITDLVGIVGGKTLEEGIQNVRDEMQVVGTFDTMATAGDPALIDHWLKDPEEGGFGTDGFVKIMPAAIDKLKSVDPAVWNHHHATVFTATVLQTGIAQTLDDLLEMPAIRDNTAATKLLQGIVGTLNAIGQVSKTAPKPELSEEFKKLEGKRKKLDEDTRTAAGQKRQDRQAPVIVKAIEDASSKFVKKQKLGKEDAAAFHQEVEGELTKLIKADTRYITQRDELVAAGEDERLFALNASKLKKYTPQAVENIERKYVKFSGKKAGDNAQKKLTGNKEVKGGSAKATIVDSVNEEKIDWRRTNPDDYLFEGRFYIKGDTKLYQKP